MLVCSLVALGNTYIMFNASKTVNMNIECNERLCICNYKKHVELLLFPTDWFVILGESVEENANVVVRLLIRRPECFGPALRGEGGSGLLGAIEDAIKISEDPARDGPTVKKDRRREL